MFFFSYNPCVISTIFYTLPISSLSIYISILLSIYISILNSIHGSTSKSSRLLCSLPRCVFIDMYLKQRNNFIKLVDFLIPNIIERFLPCVLHLLQLSLFFSYMFFFYLYICLYLSYFMSGCLVISIHLIVYLTISQYVYLSIYLFVYLPIYLSICLSVYLSICIFVYLSICLFVYLQSVYLSICLSVYLSIYLSVYLSIYLSIYLAVPVKLLCSLYGICLFVSWSIYSLARPKSTM